MIGKAKGCALGLQVSVVNVGPLPTLDRRNVDRQRSCWFRN